MKQMIRYYHIAVNVCMTLMIIIFYHLFMSSSPMPVIVTANITALTQAWITELAKQNLSADESSQILTTRIIALEEVLKKISIEYHWIIISSQNVLAGASDVTSFIESEVSEEIHKK